MGICFVTEVCMKRIAPKALLPLNLIMITAVLVLNYFYQRSGFSLTLKCVCSGGFALLGIVNLGYALITRKRNARFHFGMAGGLLLAFLGDVLIDRSFIIGAAAFALGHVCFVLAYGFLQRFRLTDLIPSAIVFLGALMFLLLCPLLTFSVPIFKAVCIVYAAIISCMLGKAIGNLIRKPCALTATLALASALFFFSDLMLVFDWFIGRWSWTSHACMGTYYPALCLMAFSMCMHGIGTSARHHEGI